MAMPEVVKSLLDVIRNMQEGGSVLDKQHYKFPGELVAPVMREAEAVQRAYPQATTGDVIAWFFQDAPKELQALSPHGGDEDYVLYQPPGYVGGIDLDLLVEKLAQPSGIYFKKRLENGAVVVITAHA